MDLREASTAAPRDERGPGRGLLGAAGWVEIRSERVCPGAGLRFRALPERRRRRLRPV